MTRASSFLCFGLGLTAACWMSTASAEEPPGGTNVAIEPPLFEPPHEGGAPASLADGQILVHLVAPPDIHLERLEPGNEPAFACRAPCDRRLPAGTYRVVGERILPSASFQLEPTRGSRTSLSVDAASRSGHLAGAIALSMGITQTLGSIVTIAIGAALSGGSESGDAQKALGVALLTYGVASGTIGLGATIAGAALLAAHSTTRVERSDDGPRARVAFAPTNALSFTLRF